MEDDRAISCGLMVLLRGEKAFDEDARKRRRLEAMASFIIVLSCIQIVKETVRLVTPDSRAESALSPATLSWQLFVIRKLPRYESQACRLTVRERTESDWQTSTGVQQPAHRLDLPSRNSN